MTPFSLYETATGRLTGDTASLSDELLAINPAPAGFAWVQGLHNPATARVEHGMDDYGNQLPFVVVQTPAPPPETDWMSWRWDAAAAAWREVPKLKLLQANARGPVIAQLAQLDDKLRRPVGEITLAQALNQAPPAAALQRLQAIEADKDALRAHLAAIAAAADVDALGALVAAPSALQTSDT